MSMIHASSPYVERENPGAFVAKVSALPTQQAQQPGPVWTQVITWSLFWPLLTLIAGQAVYFSGPARDPMVYQLGTTRGSHYSLYVYLLMLFGFVAIGYQRVKAVLQANPLIASLLLYAFVSVLWSGAPLISFQMCIQVALGTLFACYVSGRFTTERLMDLLIFMGVASGLLSVVFAVALPSYGVFAGYAGGAWQGICNQKNTLGLSMDFLLTPIFFLRRYSLWKRGLYAALMLLLIGMSQSRSAWMFTIATCCFAGWLHLMHRLRVKEAVLLLIVSVLTICFVAIFGVTHIDSIARVLGKDPSMSGRSIIYAEVWIAILKRPFIGYGFDSFWGPAVKNIEAIRIGTVIRWPNIGYAENGVLELALQLGLIGVSLVMAMFIRGFYQGSRLLRSERYFPSVGWALTVLFVEVVANIDAGRFMTSDELQWFLVIAACTQLALQTRAARAEFANEPQTSNG